MIRRLPIIPTIVVARRRRADDRRSASGSCSARSGRKACSRNMRKRRTLPPITWPTAPLRRRPAAAVPPRDRRLPARRRPARGRGREPRGRAGLRPDRRLRDRRRRAGHERRGRLVEESEREGQLGAAARSAAIIVPDRRNAHAAGRGERAAGARAERAAVDASTHPQQSTGPMRCNGSASLRSRWSSTGLPCGSAGRGQPKA